MRKMYPARRRGTSVAAAALSFALVAPFAQPVVALAEEGEPTLITTTAEPTAGGFDPSDQTESFGREVIWADGFANGYATTMPQLEYRPNILSGRAFAIAKGGTPSTMSNGLPAVPEGTTVYMEWIDKDGAVSPTYATKTHKEGIADGDQAGPGVFVFDLREPWIDANGKEHKYNATNRQHYRLWIPPLEIDGVRYSMMRQAGGFYPGSFVDSTTINNMGQFPLVGTNMQRTGVFMFQEPDLSVMTRPRDEWVDGTLRDAKGEKINLESNHADPTLNPKVTQKYHDTVSGTVWHETGRGSSDNSNSFAGPNFSARHDRTAEGYTVVISKLTKDGFAAYDKAVNSLPREARTAEAQKWLAANPNAIEFTYYTTTDAEGRYTIQLPEGTVRPVASGHTNDIYMTVLDKSGTPIQGYTPWMVPQFHSIKEHESWYPHDPGRYQGTGFHVPAWGAGRNLYAVGFASIPRYQAEIDIVNFNTTDRPARPGDTAQLVLEGTLPLLDNWIEWRDSSGKVVKGGRSECPVTSADLGPCATFTVPEQAQPGEIYTAYLVNGTEDGGNDISSDSFIVGSDTTDAGKYDPAYKATTAERNKTTEVKAPLLPDGKPVPEEATFSTSTDPNTRITGPEGFVEQFPGSLVIDPETGKITVKPAANAPLGLYQVPVVVTYGDGSKETIWAPIRVTDPFKKPEDNKKPGEADEITPSWANQKTPAGTPVTAPNIGEEIPAGSTVEASSDQGWTVEVNGTDVTVTPFPEAQTGEKSTIYVTVTYPDGSTDVETFTVTVDNNDGKGKTADTTTPDWKNAETRPSEPVKVPNTGDKLPPNSKVEAPADVDSWKVEVENPDTIVVTPPADAKPGDKIEVPVTVTYPDGSVDKETFTVTVVSHYEIEYKTTNVKVGIKATSKPGKTEKSDAIPSSTRYAQGDTKETHDGLWDIQDPAATTGAVTAKVTQDALKKRYVDERTKKLGDVCKDGGTVTDQDAKDLIDILKALMEAESSVNATFTASQKQDNAPVRFKLVDANGNPLADNPDWDGDGKDNIDEIKDCENPLDPDDQKKPDWDDAKTTPTKPVVIPKKDDSGDVKPGTKLEAEGPGEATLNPDGTITVTPRPEDAKPGDTVVVTVKGPKDDVIDTITVTIVDPNNPSWDDTTTEPTKPVVIPKRDDSGDVKPGTTLEVEGPGDATLNPDGTITVTPKPEDAKPGDTIVVTVKDPEGHVIDTVKVEIKEPVDNRTDAEKFEPKGQNQDVELNGTPDPEKNISNVADLPEGTEFEYKTPVDTSTVSEKPVVVVVTYPDGSSEEVNTTVTVKDSRTDAEKFEPKGQNQDVELNGTPDPAKNISNVADLPEGTTFEYKTPVDTSTPGTKNVVVVVTYPDGSKDQVTTTVTVTDNRTDAEKYEPQGKDQTVDIGGKPDPKRNIANAADLPAGTTYAYESPVDTSTVGDKPVVVVVTYPDGSTDKVTATVKVTDNRLDSEKYDPKGQNQTVGIGDQPDPKGNIANVADLPAGTTYAYESPVDTSTPGTKDVTVVVTYPDGSTDTVTTTVTVEDNRPKWNDTTTTPGNPVEVVKDPNSGPVKEGTTVEVTGPGTAELLPNGNIKVTPGTNAQPGDKIEVTVKDPDGKVIDTVTVTIVKKPTGNTQSEPEKPGPSDACIATVTTLGLPLLALLPLGLATAVAIPGLTPLVDQISLQLQEANANIQRQVGIMNPQLAAQAAQIDAQLRQVNMSIAQIGAIAASVIFGVISIGIIADTCSPNGGSSVNKVGVEGSSLLTGKFQSSIDEDGKTTTQGGSSQK